MITKAGVPAHKVLLGVATYGRSFKMAQEGCDGPTCLFLGDRDNSPAKKGRCTDTAGYLANAEIFEQRDKGVTRRWTDATARSSYIVYEGTEWVAYMDDNNRQWRENQAMRLNFGGTIEWAVDLQEFLDDGGLDDTRGLLWTPRPRCRGTSPHDSLEALEKDDTIPSFCLPLYALEILRKMAARSLDHYDRLIESGYDSNFGKYRQAAMLSTRQEVETWVLANADKYFTCEVEHTYPCCSACPFCGGCVPDSENYLCQAKVITETTVTGPTACPPKREILVTTTGDVAFTFISDGKKKEFYDKILADFGVAEEKMALSRYRYKRHQEGEPHKDCESTWRDCVNAMYTDIPLAEDYFVSDVPNPREIMETGIERAADVPATLLGYEWGIRSGLLQDDASIVVDALTVPVLILGEAVKNMQEIYDIAEEIKDREDKDLILAVVQLVLLIVPFIGKLAGAMTATALYIRAVANLIGDFGLMAVDIYKITEAETDEDRAMLALGIGLTGIGSLTNIPSIRQAGELRKRTSMVSIGKITKSPDARRSRDAMDKAQTTCPRYA